MMINYHYFVASCSRHDKILYLILYVDRYNVRVESEMGLQVEGFISLYINDLLRTTNFGSPGVCVPWCFPSSLFSSQIVYRDKI